MFERAPEMPGIDRRGHVWVGGAVELLGEVAVRVETAASAEPDVVVQRALEPPGSHVVGRFAVGREIPGRVEIGRGSLLWRPGPQAFQVVTQRALRSLRPFGGGQVRQVVLRVEQMMRDAAFGIAVEQIMAVAAAIGVHRGIRQVGIVPAVKAVVEQPVRIPVAPAIGGEVLVGRGHVANGDGGGDVRVAFDVEGRVEDDVRGVSERAAAGVVVGQRGPGARARGHGCPGIAGPIQLRRRTTTTRAQTARRSAGR